MKCQITAPKTLCLTVELSQDEAAQLRDFLQNGAPSFVVPLFEALKDLTYNQAPPAGYVS